MESTDVHIFRDIMYILVENWIKKHFENTHTHTYIYIYKYIRGWGEKFTSWKFIWWRHICSWWFFRPMGSKHCKTNGRSVWAEERLCWSINLIWSYSMKVFWSAYYLCSRPINLYIYIYIYIYVCVCARVYRCMYTLCLDVFLKWHINFCGLFIGKGISVEGRRLGS